MKIKNKQELQSLIEKEGNFEEFEHNGLKCVIQRNRMDCWCGYVGIDPTHALYGYEYSDTINIPSEIKERNINLDKMDVIQFFLHCIKIEKGESNKEEIPVSILIQVHGGVTFSRGQLADGRTWNGIGICEKMYSTEIDNIWWFGFDCGHAGDLCPGFFLNEQLNFALGDTVDPMLRNDIYRTKEYVITETKSLADQLSKFKFKKHE